VSSLLMYSTLGCHLCEEAQQVVVAVLGQPVLEVDIADDSELLERYGLRIPVLMAPSQGKELGWPFDVATLRDWLSIHGLDP